MSDPKIISIDGVYYTRQDQVQVPAAQLDGLDFVIVRTYSAGVFAGYLKSQVGKEAVLLHAIRFWHWQGAASLSQLAVDGTSKPTQCKFAVPVSQIVLTEAIEVIYTTEASRSSLQGVPSWKA